MAARLSGLRADIEIQKWPTESALGFLAFHDQHAGRMLMVSAGAVRRRIENKRQTPMVTFELIEQIDALLLRLRSNNYLLQVLPTLSGVHDKLLSISATAFVLDTQHDDSAQLDGHVRLDKKAKGFLKSMLQEIKGISPNKLFVGIEELKKDLSRFHNWQGIDGSEPLSHLQTKLSQFSDSYEDFLRRNYNYPDAVNTLLAANELELALESTIDLLTLVRENLIQSDPSDSQDVETLSLLLTSDLPFSLFVQKLMSLENLYLELCMLLKISPKEHPLRISRVESGSLWVRVFGESKIIVLMTSAIEAAAAYIYRNYTDEGKKKSQSSAIPRDMENLRSLLNLVPKLKELDVYSPAMKENIEKASVQISKNLNQLLANEPSITVNRNFYSGTIIAKRGYLSSAPNLLTAGDGSEDVKEVDQPPT